MDSGDELQLEPGNMSGPTRQGLSALLADDPDAYWDSGTNSIKGSAFGDPTNSPRVALITFYDPRKPPISGRNTIFVHQLGAVFIEGVDGRGNVQARFIRAVAKSPKSLGAGAGLLAVAKLIPDSSRGAR